MPLPLRSIFRARPSAGTSLLVVLGASPLAGPALAQVAPAALAECAAIGNDGERLACFDRLSGRQAGPVTAAPAATVAPTAAAATAATNAAATAATPAAATAATTTPAGDGTPYALALPDAGSSGSLFDKAWSFDTSTPRYDISLYAPNYFLFGRYTTNLNSAPFDPLVNGGLIEPGTQLDSEAR